MFSCSVFTVLRKKEFLKHHCCCSDKNVFLCSSVWGGLETIKHSGLLVEETSLRFFEWPGLLPMPRTRRSANTPPPSSSANIKPTPEAFSPRSVRRTWSSRSGVFLAWWRKPSEQREGPTGSVVVWLVFLLNYQRHLQINTEGQAFLHDCTSLKFNDGYGGHLGSGWH